MNEANETNTPFRKLIYQHWKVLWTGSFFAVALAIAGLVFTVLNLLGVETAVRIPVSLTVTLLVALLVLLVTLLVAVYLAARAEHRQRLDLEQKLKPVLEICGCVPKATGSHQRIRVHNKSATTVRFSAKLISIEPHPPHHDQIPIFLQIDSSHPPYTEANIEGNGDALVNILVLLGEDAEKRPTYGLVTASHLVTVHPIGAWISLRTTHYKIGVQVFPVSPQGPASKPRFFYITPQSDATLLLSDAGEPLFVSGGGDSGR
jgi:hypothetical protein